MLEALEGRELQENLQDMELPEFLQMDGVREFAPTSEVQAAEIRESFLDIPELQYENWKELSADQRVEALNELEQQVAEIAMRSPMEVELAVFEKPEIMGRFNGERLQIADHSLEDDSYEAYKETLNTLFHEGRHAYQYHNLYVGQVEQNTELVDSWRVNYEVLGYDSGDRMIFKEMGYYHYYSQPVEVDARVFAQNVIHELGL